jgi:hypothetical protein
MRCDVMRSNALSFSGSGRSVCVCQTSMHDLTRFRCSFSRFIDQSRQWTLGLLKWMICFVRLVANRKDDLSGHELDKKGRSARILGGGFRGGLVRRCSDFVSASAHWPVLLLLVGRKSTLFLNSLLNQENLTYRSILGPLIRADRQIILVPDWTVWEGLCRRHGSYTPTTASLSDIYLGLGTL